MWHVLVCLHGNTHRAIKYEGVVDDPNPNGWRPLFTKSDAELAQAEALAKEEARARGIDYVFKLDPEHQGK